MRMEISTTTQSINCKPILPIRQMYTMTITKKAEATSAAMTTMKATETPSMMQMNRQKRNKRLGVAGKVVLIVIRKK